MEWGWWYVTSKVTTIKSLKNPLQQVHQDFLPGPFPHLLLITTQIAQVLDIPQLLSWPALLGESGQVGSGGASGQILGKLGRSENALKMTLMIGYI
jgi:hypothetical protein